VIDPTDAERRSGAAFAPSQRIAAHLQLDSCHTLRARFTAYADPFSGESRAMARVLIDLDVGRGRY